MSTILESNTTKSWRFQYQNGFAWRVELFDSVSFSCVFGPQWTQHLNMTPSEIWRTEFKLHNCPTYLSGIRLSKAGSVVILRKRQATPRSSKATSCKTVTGGWNMECITSERSSERNMKQYGATIQLISGYLTGQTVRHIWKKPVT